MNRHRNRPTAFTLLEILLVIAILVILAGSATIMLMKQFDKGKLEMAKKDVAGNGPIAQALEYYKKDMQQYPEGDGGEASLTCLVKAPDGTPEEKQKDWPYIKGGEKALKDPWGQPYHYRYPGTNNPDGFDLWSDGPDGKPETGDEITNWEDKDEKAS